MTKSENIFPNNEHVPLPALSLAESLDRDALAEELRLQEDTTFDPAYPRHEAELSLICGNASLELALHHQTPLNEKEKLLAASETYFDRAYDHPDASAETVVDSGRFLAQLPLFETRIFNEETDDEAIAVYMADLFELGKEVEATIPETYLLQANTQLIIPSLFMREGVVLYASTWRESRFKMDKTLLPANDQVTWQHAYAIQGNSKLPVRMFGRVRNNHYPHFCGVNLYLAELVKHTDESLVAPVFGGRTTPLDASRHILGWLCQDSESKASLNARTFLDVMSGLVLRKLEEKNHIEPANASQ